MHGRTFEELIEVKRDGGRHSADEIDRIVLGFARGDVPDYQMSAWLMAALLKGLDADETVWLTDAMVRSGRVVDLSSIPGVTVDKHSTGGVADTTTLVVAPLVAACGVPVAKTSGRGLGHTGGTLDKLAAIPGFRVELSETDFVEQVRRIGLAVIAQTPDLDPADKKMYALRDVTATVPSIPLIVGSIISKKVAGGATGIVLDVKVGSGAFMKTETEARALAAELTRVGRELGRGVECVLTDMDAPLGDAVGNALEVREAVETLSGGGSPRLREVCLVLGAKMLVLGGRATTEHEGRGLLTDALDGGSALAKFREWVEAQGGDPVIADDPESLAVSPARRSIVAPRAGYVAGFDAEAVGHAAVALGAGRATKDAPIDLGAGLVLGVRVGDRVESGAPIAELFAATDAMTAEGEERLLDAVWIADEPPPARPLVLDA